LDKEPIYLFVGFVVGFLFGTYLARIGLLGVTAGPRRVVYGVKYNYKDGQLIEVLPVPVPEVG